VAGHDHTGGHWGNGIVLERQMGSGNRLGSAGPGLRAASVGAGSGGSGTGRFRPGPGYSPDLGPAAPPVAATVAAPDGAAPPSEPSEQEEAPGIVVQGDAYSRQDPVHAVNEKSYEAIQKGDKLVVAPVARLYAHGVPSPLRRGLHNALYNLREPSNFVAFLLEHKFGKAGQVLVRFTVNSTIGLAGLIDVAKAKPLRIPYRPNGLADVAGFYGIKSGPYLFLPLIGPTTLRDLIGTTIDRAWFPLAVGKPLDTVPYGLAVTVIGGLDDRNAIDGQLRKFREESADPYNATRDFYLKRRQAEIDALRHPTRRGEGVEQALGDIRQARRDRQSHQRAEARLAFDGEGRADAPGAFAHADQAIVPLGQAARSSASGVAMPTPSSLTNSTSARAPYSTWISIALAWAWRTALHSASPAIATISSAMSGCNGRTVPLMVRLTRAVVSCLSITRCN
jgi:phospholipid-binding lipoprotein MlaA